MTGLSVLPLNTIRCDVCKGNGYQNRYPRDSQPCGVCKGTGGVSIHPTAVLGYGCNRCQFTWDKPHPPYCPSCGADATHYRTA